MLRKTVVGVAFVGIAVMLAVTAFFVWPRWQRDRAVSQLLDANHRDDGIYYLLTHPKYHPKPRHPAPVPTTREQCKVNHVVTCPQPIGSPIYAVFLRGKVDAPGTPKGRLILIDDDGAIVPHDVNADDDKVEFKDINADGIVDCVHPVAWGAMSGQIELLSYGVQITPITRTPRPALVVGYNKQTIMMSPWRWRLTDSDSDGVYDVEFGSNMNPTKAVFRWSLQEQEWVGPSGGEDQRFMRFMSADNWMEIENWTVSRPVDWDQRQ